MGIRMRGDFGTKVNALVRWLLYQKQQHDRWSGEGAAHMTGRVDDSLMETLDASEPPKALCFSQWGSELILVGKALAMNNISFVEFKGSLEQQSRAIHRFSNDPTVRVFLLSTGTANAGLTLVSATSVFILEPSLNPAIEEQAINRVHRIGQTRPTTIFRFVVMDSVEETIIDLVQSRKKCIAGASTAAEDTRRSAVQVWLSTT